MTTTNILCLTFLNIWIKRCRVYNGLAENCDFQIADECQTATYFSSIRGKYEVKMGSKSPLWKHPAAWLPVALSLIMLAILLGIVATDGIVHEEDEGTAAHIFQIWMVLEILMVAFFVAKWLPKNPRQTLQILALQIAAALLPMSFVFFLKL